MSVFPPHIAEGYSWRTEHPEFTEADLPGIPLDWKDASYSNDNCPKWVAFEQDAGNPTSVSIEVFTDFEDADRRANGPDQNRYSVGMVNPDGEWTDLYDGNNWADVLFTVNIAKGILSATRV